MCVGGGIYSPGTGAEKSNPRFPLGWTWKESRRGKYGARAQDGPHPAPGRGGIPSGPLFCSSASSQVFANQCPPFGVEKGGRAGPALHHFGSSEVNSRLAGMSLGQRVPQCPTTLTAGALLLSAVSVRGAAVDERGEDTQGVGVEVGRAARWDVPEPDGI